MAGTTLPQKVETREQRGIALALERGEEIEHLGRGRFLVPGCSGGGPYEVRLAVLDDVESCTCPDFTTPRRGREDGEPCKHIFAATMVRANRQAKMRRELHRRWDRRRLFSPEAAQRFLSGMGA